MTHQFKPVQQSRQQSLRSHCPNIYNVPGAEQSSLLRQKVQFEPLPVQYCEHCALLLPSSSLPIDVSQISRWDNFLTVYYQTRLHQCNVTYTRYESIKKYADHIFDLPITTYLYFAQVADLYVYQLDYIIELTFGRELCIFSIQIILYLQLPYLLCFLFMENGYLFYCSLSYFLFHLIICMEFFLMDHNFVASNVCSILKVSALKEGKIQ